MLGLFQGRKLAATAERLKHVTEQVIGQYLHLPGPDLEAHLERDLGKDAVYADRVEVLFRVPSEPNFRFCIDMGGLAGTIADRSVAVFGEGLFQGFLLSAGGRGKWVCSATDSLQFRATRQAKGLAQVFERRFGVIDTSWLG
jgi:hypothetical protein